MQEVKKYQRSIIKWVYFISFIVLVYIYLFNKTYVIGYVLGVCTSLIVFNSRVNNALKLVESGSRSKVFVNYLIRYFIYGVAISLSFLFEKINTTSMLVGIFQIYLIILLQVYFSVKSVQDRNDN